MAGSAAGVLALGLGRVVRARTAGTVGLASIPMDPRDLDALADLARAGGVVVLSGVGLSIERPTASRSEQERRSEQVYLLR